MQPLGKVGYTVDSGGSEAYSVERGLDRAANPLQFLVYPFEEAFDGPEASSKPPWIFFPSFNGRFFVGFSNTWHSCCVFCYVCPACD